MSDFTTISTHYQQTSVVQKSAGERLFDLLGIQDEDDVLDLGCGPGNLTRRIRCLTKGRVVGIDPSQGMIEEARKKSDLAIEFHAGPAESLDMPSNFDVIFCNSAFQWFKKPEPVLVNCFAALRSGGRMAIQAPARNEYCPNFVRAVNSLKDNPETRDVWAHFRSPWFFLETAKEYADLFSNAGFLVELSELETVTQQVSPQKVMEVFESGAAAGYLNPDCYDITLPKGYPEAVRDTVCHHFASQAGEDGNVALTFYRIYLLARKP